MSASCFPECKDLQPENFCRHYKTYCKSMVNIRKACKKTCGLCKYSVGTRFITCTSALMKKSRVHAFLLSRITLLQIKVKDSASLPRFRIFPIHPCIFNITVPRGIPYKNYESTLWKISIKLPCIMAATTQSRDGNFRFYLPKQ